MSTADTRLKYRIKECLIRKFGVESAIRKAKADIHTLHGISPGTINYDINLQMCEHGEIPEARLQKYAAFIGVSVDHLKSDYIKSIRTQIL